MAINVGDYIRTKNGIIDKVIIEYNGHCASPNCNCKHVSCERDYYDEDEIIKSSPNIIDLIEVGDYVNGYYVEDIDTIYDKDDTYTKISLASGCDYLQPPIYEPKQIKSIVTKEQFESMEYKIDR
ncbi:hypothetical protein IKS57_01795 [bacterium]|nr:hypothetical protein [bacterium]